MLCSQGAHKNNLGLATSITQLQFDGLRNLNRKATKQYLRYLVECSENYNPMI